MSKSLNLSTLTNNELTMFFIDVKRDNLWHEFINDWQHSLTQERINQIDSWTWRKLINIQPLLAMWCDNSKLEVSDISNISMNQNLGNLMITKQITNSSIKYVYNSFINNKNHKYTNLLKLKETQKQFILSFPSNFDLNKIINLFTFQDNSLNNLGLSFDFSNNKNVFVLNKDESNISSKELLILIDKIIKNNLFRIFLFY